MDSLSQKSSQKLKKKPRKNQGNFLPVFSERDIGEKEHSWQNGRWELQEFSVITQGIQNGEVETKRRGRKKNHEIST